MTKKQDIKDGVDALFKARLSSIRKEAGKRCKDFNINCYVCQVHLALDILEDYVSETESQNKEEGGK
jgi:hypothetical protein